MRVAYPPSGQIGVRVSDLKLTAVNSPEVTQIKQLIYDYKFVVIAEQNINKFQYLQFANSFGNLQVDLENNSFSKYSNLSASRSKISNLDKYWHSDRSFLQEPSPFTMVYVNNLPQATRAIYFIDMEQAYRELPQCFKNYLADKKALHELQWHDRFFANDHLRDLNNCSQTSELLSVARHPLVIVHPVTGAEILYLNSGYTTRIDGMDYLISQKVLDKLFSEVEEDKYIQPYILQEGDILLWSNRTLNYLDSLTGDLGNIFHDRISISDGLPFYYSSIRKAIEQAQHQTITLNF